MHTPTSKEMPIAWLTPEVPATGIQPGAETKLGDLGEHPQAPWINKEPPKLKVINAKTRS